MGAFDDLYTANDAYAATFTDRGLTGTAARGLAVLTCIDSRIDPLAALGLAPGDAKIIRNAGARVTGETLITLILAVYLLGVERIFLMPHTDCGVTKVKPISTPAPPSTASTPAAWISRSSPTRTPRCAVIFFVFAPARSCLEPSPRTGDERRRCG